MKKGLLFIITLVMLLSITGCSEIKSKTKLELFMEKLEENGFTCNKESLICIYENQDVIDKPEVYDSKYLSHTFDLENHIYSTRYRIFGTNNINGNVYEDDRTSIYNYEEDKSYSIVDNYKYDCQTNLISFTPGIGSRQQVYNCNDNISIYDIYYYWVTPKCPLVKQQCDVAKRSMSSYMGDYTIDDLLEEND